MDEELRNLRERIDAIDREMVDLLGDRVEAAKEISEVKEKMGLSITDSLREEEVLRNVSSRTKLDNEFIEKLFRIIIGYCKNEERK